MSIEFKPNNDENKIDPNFSYFKFTEEEVNAMLAKGMTMDQILKKETRARMAQNEALLINEIKPQKNSHNN